MVDFQKMQGRLSEGLQRRATVVPLAFTVRDGGRDTVVALSPGAKPAFTLIASGETWEAFEIGRAHV